MTGTPPSFRDGLSASLSIVLGYFPIAFSFGVAATRAGFTGLETTALSLIIYAGASQFLALALLASGAPVLVNCISAKSDVLACARPTTSTLVPVVMTRYGHSVRQA